MAVSGVSVSWSRADVLKQAQQVLAPIKGLLLGRTAWFSKGETSIIWECTEAAFQDTNVSALADMVRYFAEANAEDAWFYASCKCLHGDPHFETDYPPARRVDLSAEAAALRELADMWEIAE